MNKSVKQLPYIPYLKALDLLAERLGATPENFAIWLLLGSYRGGLNAYLHANELKNPPVFRYDYSGSADDIDYVAPLMACWFLKSDIEKLTAPIDEYLSGKVLIERWSEIPGIQVTDFIRAKIYESRILDMHPICGLTQGSRNYDDSSPPLEYGIFALSEVEEIEKEDFSKKQQKFIKIITSEPNIEDAAGRKQRLESWLREEIRLRGERGSLQRTADREGISRQTLSAILKRKN